MHQDREESGSFAGMSPPQTLAELRSQVDAVLAQLVAATQRIQVLTAENETVRQEIAALHRQSARKPTTQPASLYRRNSGSRCASDSLRLRVLWGHGNGHRGRTHRGSFPATSTWRRGYPRQPAVLLPLLQSVQGGRHWPGQSNDPVLWNPRREAVGVHLLALADGTLYPITSTGMFTLRRLRLNREPLVAYRRRKQSLAEVLRLMARFRDVVTFLEQLQKQQMLLLQEHHALLEEQRAVLKVLLGEGDASAAE